MVNWTELANRKYANMEAGTAAQRVAADASARNAATSASLAPTTIADTQAQTAQRIANTAQIPFDAQQNRDYMASMTTRNNVDSHIPTRNQIGAAAAVLNPGMSFKPIDEAGLPQRPAVAEVYGRGAGMGPGTPPGMVAGQGVGDVLQAFNGGMSGTVDPVTGVRVNRGRMGLAKGIARVPGKGSSKVDSVKAMLAPDEAVLNKAAADTLGRGLISVLNAHGAQKMGLA